MSQPEHVIQNQTRLALGKYGHIKLFRNNVGEGWTGSKSIQITQNTYAQLEAGDVVVKNARRFQAGLPNGSSDLLGWTTGADGIARFTSLEVKTATGRPTAEQKHWLETVRAAGGIADVIRSPDDAIRIATNFMEPG